jgi:hypothetical protein
MTSLEQEHEQEQEQEQSSLQLPFKAITCNLPGTRAKTKIQEQHFSSVVTNYSSVVTYSEQNKNISMVTYMEFTR